MCDSNVLGFGRREKEVIGFGRRGTKSNNYSNIKIILYFIKLVHIVIVMNNNLESNRIIENCEQR